MPSPERSPQRDGTADSSRVRAPHRARVAAVVALIVLFFLFWFTFSLVANDPVGLVFTFVSVFLIAWFFLVRRGVRRLLVLPLGLFALVALLTYGYDQKYQLVVIRAAGALRARRPLCGTSPSSAASARGAPACTARAAGTERCADHQSQIGGRKGRALSVTRRGEEKRSNRSCSRRETTCATWQGGR